MAVICIIVILYFLFKNAVDEQKDKERKEDLDIRFENGRNWAFKVQNRKFEEDLVKSLESSYSSDCALFKELSDIYNQVGITNRNPLCWRTFKEEAIFLLLVNRGYLPRGVVEICERYYNSDMRDIHFRDNAHVVITWAKSRLDSFGIHVDIYATASTVGNPPFYRFGSEAYQYLINEGVQFFGYIWEPMMSPYDMHHRVEFRSQISDKEMSIYRRYMIK